MPRKRAAKRTARRVVAVRGTPVKRADRSGPWTSPPEEILWETYLRGMKARPGRWPNLKGLQRQVRAGRYYIDFARPDLRQGIEVDGLAYHNGQEAFARDHARQRWLRGAGWQLVRYTAKEAAMHPSAVLDEVNWLWAPGR